MDNVELLRIQRVTEEGKTETEDTVTRELPLTIILNNRELVTMLCSPTNLDYLAIGFLSSEGLINSKDEIKKLIVDDRRGVVRVETGEEKPLAEEMVFKRLITSGCGAAGAFYRAADTQNMAKVESKVQVTAATIFNLMREFQHRSELYRSTGGVHSAALADNQGITVFAEDIGRHNAIDKIFGQCIMTGMPIAEHMVITSGRISSEMVLKVAKRRVPVIISASAPTSLGVKFGVELGITVIGFARGKRMNVYANDWRIVTG